MGGNALKKTRTRRYEKSEFFVLQNTIKSVFDKINLIENIDYYFVKAFEDKESFGDMDVLYQCDKKLIISQFSPNEVVYNGPVTSLDFNELQIDFIEIQKEDWNNAKYYYDYNDFGGLVGKIAKSQGLFYSETGLKLKLVYKNQNKTFLISKDPELIFNFLGFDTNRYRKGFKNLTEIAQYLSNSKYFSISVFTEIKGEHGESKYADRDGRRPTYKFMLDYFYYHNIETEPQSNINIFSDIDKVFGYSNLESDYNYAKFEIEREIEAKSKLNGDVVMKHFGVEGKRVGEILKIFKTNFKDKSEYEEYIIGTPIETILSDINYIFF